MHSNIEKLKSIYKRELKELQNSLNLRLILIEYIGDEVKSRISENLHNMTKDQLETTRLLVSFIDAKLNIPRTIESEVMKKEFYSNNIKDIDLFFNTYPIVNILFNKLHNEENQKYHKQRLALQEYKNSLLKVKKEEEFTYDIRP
jgi:hypothetical protein